MSGLAHVVKSSSSCSLLLPLHDFDTLDVGAVDLVPHLDTHTGQVVAEEDGRVDALATDVQTYTSVLVAILQANKEDITRVCAVDVLAAEEAGTSTSRVEGRDLGGGNGGDGVLASCASRRNGREDRDLLHTVFAVCRGVRAEKRGSGGGFIVLRPVMMAPGWKLTGLPGMVGAAVA